MTCMMLGWHELTSFQTFLLCWSDLFFFSFNLYAFFYFILNVFNLQFVGSFICVVFIYLFAL